MDTLEFFSNSTSFNESIIVSLRGEVKAEHTCMRGT